MENEDNKGKVIVFSPSGFILKLIFSVTLIIIFNDSIKNNFKLVDSVVLNAIFSYTLCFVTFWFLSTLFGFCLRATGNYIIAIILMMLLLFLIAFAGDWLSSKSSMLETVSVVIFILVLIWIPINDIRKAILYIKNTT